MYCLKCGKEAREDQVFCAQCLADMEKYPVKPGTAIQLPTRSEKASSKKPPHKARSLPAEELITRLRGTIRRMWLAMIALAVAVCILAAALAHTLITQEKDSYVGRNYTTVGPSNSGRQP